jgi:hypothetical protein
VAVLFSSSPEKYDYRPLQQLLCYASPFQKKKKRKNLSQIFNFSFFSYLFMMKRPFWVSREFRGPFETGTFIFFFPPQLDSMVVSRGLGSLEYKRTRRGGRRRRKKAFSCASVSLSSSSLSFFNV